MSIKGLTQKISNQLYSLTDKERKKEQFELRKPVNKRKEYSERHKAALDEYLEREPYEFNLNADKLYSHYADQYKRQGEAAMRDTIAHASEKTGGYGSSYGTVAGQQAYQSYLDKLNEIVPALESAAYDRYIADVEGKRADVEMLEGLSDKEYDKYRDDVEDYKDLRDYYRSVYEYDSDADMDMYKALTDYVLAIAKLENSDYYGMNELDLARRNLDLSREKLDVEREKINKG